MFYLLTAATAVTIARVVSFVVLYLITTQKCHIARPSAEAINSHMRRILSCNPIIIIIIIFVY